ncbi:hypothetical protein BU16DRAFT_512272 [Lophium mytilinum]|uniref:Uncharacterized protein n=1 Tax=Lophium mytilinum TaxID=390894 RepID=A0A6A6QNF5_9PEZI|nr:hypothetical protein BU16DRAFT_512272 [Lophium mytilinum]
MVDSGIHNGFWTNWSNGKYLGATITLPATQGLILVAFLALFVQASGGFFWRVVCFALHQFRSSSRAKDGLHHQQQALLRNAASSSNAVWEVTKTAWQWRKHARNTFSRSIPLVLVCLVHLAIFGLAGLFSSRVVTTGNEALVRSDVCGWPKSVPNPISTPEDSFTESQLATLNSQAVLGRWSYTQSASYARTCYDEQTGRFASLCSTMVRPRLNSTITRGAPCPFAADVCEMPALKFDSGLVDSNDDMGLNARKEDSIQIRRVTTCAPILIEQRYSSGWTEFNGTLPGDTYKAYRFGPDVPQFLPENVTMAVSNYSQYLAAPPYTTGSFNSYLRNASSSDYIPISDLNSTDSDVSILSIINRAVYLGNVTDPLFRATNDSYLPGFKTASQVASFLGCTQQYQFCSRRTTCTPLTGLYDVRIEAAKTLNLTPIQASTFTLLWKSAWSMTLQLTTVLLGSNMLLANDYLWGATSYSSSLPDNQWEVEAANMHNISLAMLQRSVVEYASPPDIQIRPGLRSPSQMEPPADDGMRALCQNQKVISKDHAGFSVVGLAIILAVGSLLILLDLFVARIVLWIGWGRFASMQDEWVQQGLLQVQRQALEARGIGPWEGKDGDVPVLVGDGDLFRSSTTTATESNIQLKRGVVVGYQSLPDTPVT